MLIVCQEFSAMVDPLSGFTAAMTNDCAVAGEDIAPSLLSWSDVDGPISPHTHQYSVTLLSLPSTISYVSVAVMYAEYMRL